MANIRKTFNFRNGVQVDDDNLIVNQTGLVGIGTSVPTEILDVRGTAKVVGLLTATEVFTSNIRAIGVSTFSGGLRVGIVSVGQNGIVTATSGVVTYYGDGGRLLNLPTSQWLDVDIGLGFTSIYAQGFVGVGTISPFYPFQVGGTDKTRLFESVGARGVGIDSTGNIYSTGIVTARSYLGIGIGLTDLNASNIEYGTLNNARLPANINVSGIVTSSRVVTGSMNVGPGGANITGVVTATGGFIGNVTGNVTGNVVGDIVGNVTGIASTARSLTGTPDIIVGFVTSTQINSNISSTGISSVTNRLYVQNSIGINTVTPTADVHLVKNGVGGVFVTSTQESFVGVARTITRGQQGGEIRFGNLSGSLSGERALDLVNYDTGNINQYIHSGSAGINTGNFNWVYGQGGQPVRMTLTWDGKLGIAKTNPDRELHVVGTSTITEDLYIGDDLFVKGDSSFTGDLTVAGNFTTNNLNVSGGISANLNNLSGVSTFYDINVTNIGKLNKVAIGTDDSIFSVQIGTNSDLSNGTGIVASSNFVGLGSTAIYPQIEINAIGQRAILRAVGIGTTRPKAAVDFSEAGTGYFSDAYRFMLLPRLTTTQRNNLDTTTDNIRGAVVFNTTTLVPEYYTGSTWVQMAQSGTISYAERSGIATYANSAGFSTDAANVIGGIVTCTSLAVFPGAGGGISTFAGITTVTGPTFFAKQINVSGVSTLGNTVVGGATTQLIVNGDARITGILTIGTSSITFDGINNTITIGTGTTLRSGGSASFNNGLNVSGISTFQNTVLIGTGVTIQSGIVTAVTIKDSKGDVRTIPQNAQSGAYELTISDVGKHISITTGGVTVPASIFSAGDAITIFNNSGSSQTITQGTSVTLFSAGTSSTGNRTLAQRGVCTVLCVGSNQFVIFGIGIS